MKWTGVSKALLLPPKVGPAANAGFSVPYAVDEEGPNNTGSLPWNQGFNCQGPELKSPSPMFLETRLRDGI